MDTDKTAFDRHDAVVLYAALSAGEKGITSEGIVLLSDYVEHADPAGRSIDKSLEKLEEAHLLRRRGRTYFASRSAADECGPRIAQHQSIPAAIQEVLQYLSA